jgi:3-hydroxyacyl-[acyl-carrier-protein] dehydratase
MPPKMLVDLTQIDLNSVEADIEAIRKLNQQRYEFEMLTGIIKYNAAENWVVAYLDTSDEDFWVRGHVPGRPLMPGVLICECAAQACSYCYGKQQDEDRFLGFYGMDGIRFRGQVLPGDRLIMVARLSSAKTRISMFDCQGFVNGRMVYVGQIQGIAL